MKRFNKNLNKFNINRNLEPIDDMEQVNMNAMIQQMANLQITLEKIQTENAALRARIEQIPVNPAVIPQAVERLEPDNISYTNANDINLDVFKALPVFDGNITKYRVWREDVSRLMDGIRIHRNSNRYVEALSIIKTKIQGAAADVLTNHNTIFNFDAIRNRLDYTYADQRPLYVLQDEMKRLTQGKHNLSEFHDNVNKALTLITSKVAMSGHNQEVIKVMTDEATQEAVRVFKDGINNSYIRSTLYGNPIRDLEHAFAVARTIEHDDEHRKLRLSYSQYNLHPSSDKHYNERQYHQRRPMYQPRYYNNQQTPQLQKPEPMDTSSGNTTARQQTQYQHDNYNRNGYNNNWKRPRGNSGQFTNQQQKHMRNNNLASEEDNSSLIVETGKQNHLVIKHLN